MDTLSSVLAHDHDRCDVLFARACAQVRTGDWEGAAQSAPALAAALERHVRMEESVVFDALDAALRSQQSATATLRADHRRMEGVLMRLLASQRSRDASAFFKHAATLRVLLQSHHEREEQVFYPAAERILRGQREQLLAGLRDFAGAVV